MSKFCQICGKGRLLVITRKKLRGKYNPTTKIRKKPNLHWVFVPLELTKKPYGRFAGKKILACGKCIKKIGKLRLKNKKIKQIEPISLVQQ